MVHGTDLAPGVLESGLQATCSVLPLSLRLLLCHSFKLPESSVFPWMFTVQFRLQPGGAMLSASMPSPRIKLAESLATAAIVRQKMIFEYR